MDVMVWGPFGAIICWLASRVQWPSDRQGVLSTVAGILGALLGGGLVPPVAGHFHLPALVMSLAGAALLAVAVHVLRWETPALNRPTAVHPTTIEVIMSQAPFSHEPLGTVRLWVLADDLPIGASIGEETLHYRYRPHRSDDDAWETYLQNSPELDAAARRRFAAGSCEPVMLRDVDVRVTPRG